MLNNKKINIISVLFILFIILFLTFVFFKNHKYAHHDAIVFHAYGMSLIAGESPYDIDNFRKYLKIIMVKEGFDEKTIERRFKEFLTFGAIHPPSLAVYTVPPAFFDWNIAKYYYDIINVIALLAIIVFFMLWIDYLPHVQIDFNKLIIAISLGCLMRAVSMTMMLGQLSLISLAGCWGTLYFSERKKFFIAGLFIILASLKPHIGLLLVVYLLIRWKSWLLFIWPSFLFIFISLFVLIIGGDLNPLPEIASNYKNYSTVAVNLPDHVPGLTYLFGYFFDINRINFMLTGLIIVVALAFWSEKIIAISSNNIKTPEAWARYREEQSILIIAFIFAITALFMPLRWYDHVVFIPVFALLAVIRWHLAMWLLPGLILIIRPQRIATAFYQMTGMEFTYVLFSSLGIVYLTLIILFIMWKLRQDAQLATC